MLYLAGDPISSFLLAAGFAWLVHSSVAAVLLFATLAAQGVLPANAAFAMVLGANLGGSMIAFFLTLGADVAVRRVVWTNLLLRGFGAAVVLLAISAFALPVELLGSNAGQQALHLHLLFNAALLLCCLPFVGLLMRAANALIADPAASGGQASVRTALDRSVQDQPKRAFGCALRELIDMGNRIENMLRAAIGLFEHYDDLRAEKLLDDMQKVAQTSLDIRVYLAGVRSPDAEEDTGTRAFDLSGIAVNLEAGADEIALRMVELAKSKDRENLSFSLEGWRELSDFHDVVLRNVQHGISVLLSEDVGLARELVEEKQRVRALEQELQRKHLKRLRMGLVESQETSAIHLDLLRALKTLNTSFAMIAYPLLKNSGELLESRLAGNSGPSR